MVPVNNPIFMGWAKDFIIGVDALHAVKGHMGNLLKVLCKDNARFNEATFLCNLSALVQRRMLSDLDGKHIRLLVLKCFVSGLRFNGFSMHSQSCSV
jgi:hypothetical protein